MKHFSLQTRLISTHILMALGSILLVGILTIVITLQIFKNREEEYMYQIAQVTILDLTEFFEVSPHGVGLEDILTQRGFKQNLGLRIVSSEGEVLAQSRTIDLIEGNPLLPYYRCSLYIEPLQGDFLELYLHYEDFLHPLSFLVRGVLVAALVALFLAFIVGRFSGKHIARPIIQLSNLADGLSHLDWSHPLPQSDAYELDILSQSIDDMRHDLHHTFLALEEERDKMKRFMQDASHQLRTPITALNTYLELLQCDFPGIEEHRDDIIQDSRDQVVKLSWIISDLLDLTRLENMGPSTKSIPFELKDCCRSAWAALKGEADKKSLFFDILGPACPYEGDPQRIEMAISNILDNAIKWSPHGGRIEVHLLGHPQSYQIRIKDEGPGIPTDEQKRVFERFYQSPSGGSQGTGLGLAVVATLMEGLGGKAEAKAVVDQGACIELTFPISKL